MKTLFISLLSFIVLLSCKQNEKKESTHKVAVITQQEQQNLQRTAEQIADTLFTFEKESIGKLPSHWSQDYTGKKGEAPKWQIVEENGNKVLAQLTKDNPNYHFNVIVFDGLLTKNAVLEVELKGVSGRKDQGGGFVWRYIDADNYYVVRANPLEDNVVLYKVVNGKRTDLPVVGKGRTYGVDVAALGNAWNILKLKVQNDLFIVYLNGSEIFQVQDQTFNNIGKIGLWSKADAVTYFDNFKYTYIR